MTIKYGLRNSITGELASYDTRFDVLVGIPTEYYHQPWIVTEKKYADAIVVRKRRIAFVCKNTPLCDVEFEQLLFEVCEINQPTNA